MIVESPKTILNVWWEDVLQGATYTFKKESFDSRKQLDVHFEEEMGIDTGGPSREFFRLAASALQSSAVFAGEPGKKYLAKSYTCKLT